MDQGKVARYRNQIGRFDVDFDSKEIFFLEQEVLKWVGNRACRKTVRSSVGYRLTLVDNKRRKLSPGDDVKYNFLKRW